MSFSDVLMLVKATLTFSSCILLQGCGGGGNSPAPKDECVIPGSDTYDMLLPLQNRTIAIPPVPTDIDLFSYATNNALIAIPAKCLVMYKGELGNPESNLQGRPPSGPTGMYYFRISNPSEQYLVLAKMTDCSCGLVIMMHGSSGADWNSATFADVLSGLGYVVVMPDSMAMPDGMRLKGNSPLKDTNSIDTSNYCGEFNPYDGTCSNFGKPFCFSTSVDDILNDATKYKQYVERNYLIRKQELDYFVKSRVDLLTSFQRVFLGGRSEGAMVAARYYNVVLHEKLSGMFLSGWTCEYNYFVSCKEHAKLCEGKCSSSIPQLNLQGEHDEFFGGISTSIASRVAASSSGYGGPITGNCRMGYDAQGFKYSTVVVFPSASHASIYQYDNRVRSLIADFLYDPSNRSSWQSLRGPGCTLAAGFYTCDAEVQNGPPCLKNYTVNFGASYNFSGKLDTCAYYGHPVSARIVDV